MKWLGAVASVLPPAPCEMCKEDGIAGDCVSCDGANTEGCRNASADKVERIDKTWSDCNLNQEFKDGLFERLRCGACGGRAFEVLRTGDYETSARCNACGVYYIVHNG